MKKNKGFTLIELLMAVLIVGVLSAVAVPQYTKAIERSRATEAMNLVKSINDAVYAYAAGRSSGACPTTFRQLSITLPTEDDNTDTITTKNFEYKLNGATAATVPGTHCAGVLATRINGGRYDYEIWNPYRVRSEQGRARLGCRSVSDDELSNYLCTSLGLYVEGAVPYSSSSTNGPEDIFLPDAELDEPIGEEIHFMHN